MGRPRKPSSLRLLEGNRGKRPILPEPTAAPGLPPAPDRFTPAERGAYRAIANDLRKLNVLQVVDRTAVELAAYHLARRRRLAAFLLEAGETYTSESQNGSEMIRSRPEVAMLGASDAYLAAFFSQAGMTPAARAKLGAAPEPPHDATWFPAELRGDQSHTKSNANNRGKTPNPGA